ncbi:MAG: ABC transporter substrate-binding protein, partial [Alcanivoracaceae bacterium]|nr:ABC transporter substrate-binding protein [Alcanivoracaceae bacterium]
GWVFKGRQLVDANTGQPFEFEILLSSQAFERVVLPFVRNLKRLGITATIRVVDQSQYINRVRRFDFDMIIPVWGQSESPGNEQREMWTSAAAKRIGSRNYIGIQDPVIDELVELVIQAPTREELVARTKALDYVLLSHNYVIPQWYLNADRYAVWDKFGWPPGAKLRGVRPWMLWVDPAKAARLRGKIKSEN